METVASDSGLGPRLWKADVESAFSRIPVHPRDRWACGFAFKHGEDVWASQHHACPFGAVASVHAWERVGEAIAQIARVLLKLPVCRYVDYYLSAER